MNVTDQPNFWSFLERLVRDHPVVIDRPRGTRHPRHEDIIYPLDYGYLNGTTSIDQGGIDVWVGEAVMDGSKVITGLILTVDMSKKDAEMKIALNCREEDLQTILDFHHTHQMGAILVRNPERMYKNEKHSRFSR